MKPDYKNWLPKGMVFGIFAGAAVCVALFLVFLFSSLIPSGTMKTILVVIFGIASAVTIGFGIWAVKMRSAFPMRERGRCRSRSSRGLRTM